jgi:hypothetical protein
MVVNFGFRFLKKLVFLQQKEEAGVCSLSFFCLFEFSYYWDDGTPDGQYKGRLPSGLDTTTNTYKGHRFIFKNKRE